MPQGINGTACNYILDLLKFCIDLESKVSIQCFVPLDMVESFTAQMNAWLGEGACVHYQIAEKGAHAAWL